MCYPGLHKMKKRKFASAVFALLVSFGLNAQSNNHRLSWWPAYYLKYSINKRWMVNSDIQFRNFAKEPVLGLIAMRSGAHYRINNNWTVGFGTAWFHQRQINDDKSKVITDELRLWEELRHEVKVNKWQLINQFRTEQRHWIKQDGLAYRFRYRIGADYIFNERWKAMAGNELVWQSSKTRKNWDQDRIWIGGEYAFNTNSQVQLMLMNWWQFNTNSHQPVLRINFVQAIGATL